MARAFDPEAGALPDSGIFGLLHSRDEAAVVLVPVPFDATVSYGVGASAGPAAIVAASHQVDLFDLQTGRPYERGIHMLEDSAGIAARSARARELAAPIIARGGADESEVAIVAQVDAICAEVHAEVATTVAGILAEGRIPGIVGGDHSVALGGIQAMAAHRRARGEGEFGVLQVDAHADLRQSYEGFRYSHASIMDNVLREVPEVSRLVQVGVRDVCESEVRVAAEDRRILQHHDFEWRRRMATGEPLIRIIEEAVGALPRDVYVSFDIDGLDPALCPGTGTPVPGGLGFQEACLLLSTLLDSGRRIVGFDLCEVAPTEPGEEWNGNVGARVLYKLCGFALHGG